tara:strand:- start:1761 stop:3182 length:1422 start_codon:yes stop_codon:yes gene_type:complete
MLVFTPFICAFATLSRDTERKLYAVEEGDSEKHNQEKDTPSPFPPTPPPDLPRVGWMEKFDYASECAVFGEECGNKDCCNGLVCSETLDSVTMIAECRWSWYRTWTWSQIYKRLQPPPAPPPALRYATKKELEEARSRLGDMLSNLYKWVTDLVYQDWAVSSPRVSSETPDVRSESLKHGAYAQPTTEFPVGKYDVIPSPSPLPDALSGYTQEVLYFSDVFPPADPDAQIASAVAQRFVSAYTCHGLGFKCRDRLHSKQYVTEVAVEEACDADPNCKAYDFSQTFGIGHLCSTGFPEWLVDGSNSWYKMCTSPSLPRYKSYESYEEVDTEEGEDTYAYDTYDTVYDPYSQRGAPKHDAWLRNEGLWSYDFYSTGDDEKHDENRIGEDTLEYASYATADDSTHLHLHTYEGADTYQAEGEDTYEYDTYDTVYHPYNKRGAPEHDPSARSYIDDDSLYDSYETYNGYDDYSYQGW